MSRWVTLQEAAAALGVSELTIKRRLKSGQLTGRQEKIPTGFRWYIELPDAAEAAPEPTPAVPSSDSRDTLIEAQARLIATLEQDKTQLWEEVNARRQEVRELHILLRQAQSQIPIPMGQPTAQIEAQRQVVSEGSVYPHIDRSPEGSVNGHTTGQKPWWQFWKRWAAPSPS